MGKTCQLIYLFFSLFLLTSCLGITRHYISVKTIDVDTGLPVSGINILVGNIEHSSNASNVKIIKTNNDGSAKMTYYAARKDAIRITIQPDNGYHTIGKFQFDYLEYQRVVDLNVYVKK